MTHELCVGSKLFIKNMDIMELSLCADKLQKYVGSNMDDIPDMPYDQLYLLYQSLGDLKWRLVEMLGKESIKCSQ